MLYLSTLIRNCPAKIIRNARKVKLSGKPKAFIARDEKGEFKQLLAVTRDKDGPRQVEIRIYMPKGKKIRGKGTRTGPSNKCWVTCSCPYWRYHCEVSVAARGSSNVLISNGQFPKIRNPRMKPYLCKHLLWAAKLAMKIPAERKSVSKIENVELDRLVQLLEPFIPKSA